jgi:hypothetical protein
MIIVSISDTFGAEEADDNPAPPLPVPPSPPVDDSLAFDFGPI